MVETIDNAVVPDEQQQQLEYDRRIARAGAEKALELAEKRRKREEEENAGEDIINPKAVKTVKSVVELFSAFQQMAKTPAQQAFDDLMAKNMANTLMNAGNGPPKRDLLDTILNSQFAYGVGQGIGNRGPELIESMGRTFGPQRAGDMIDGMMGRGQQRQIPGQTITLGPGNPGGGVGVGGGIGGGGGGIPGTGVGLTPEQQKNAQQKDLLMTLDPNNPEHVTAYSMTQGDIPVDVARKMLMIHQDAIIDQMKQGGRDISAYTKRTVAVPAGGFDGSGVDNIRQYRQPDVQAGGLPEAFPEERLAPDVDQQIVGQEQIQQNQEQQAQAKASSISPELMDYMRQMNECIVGLTNTVNSLQNDIDVMKKGKQEDQNQNIPEPQNITVEDNKLETENNKLETENNKLETEVKTETEVKAEVVEVKAEVVEVKAEVVEVKKEKAEVKEDDKETETPRDVRLCPKCKKIKPLIETEKGFMCIECRNRLGGEK